MRSARSKKWSNLALLGFFLAAAMVSAVPAAAAENGGVDQNQGRPQEQKPNKQVLYEWTDSQGNVHLTDQPGKVPQRYRSTVRRVEVPAAEGGEPASPGRSRATGPSDAEEREADLKDEWQRRMRGARERLASLQQQYQSLAQKRDEALGRWGGAASGHLEDREEAARIDGELKALQQKIDAARHEVDVVIPDEARKAGIPPGWLRE